MVTGSADKNGDVLPRPKRRRKRRKEDRGLPSDSELEEFVIAYLDEQSKLWPDLAAKSVIPEPTPEVVASLAEDFKRRHRGGKINLNELTKLRQFKLTLAGNYNRFSSDNSEPTSITDQIINSIRKAKEKGYFIPWQLVFCDYARSGLISTARNGYMGYKRAIADKSLPFVATFIDDFTRASREALEWWKLAHLSKYHKKKMLGASDGFDLDDANWDVWVTVYGLVSRLFIKQLKQKVKRGMSSRRSKTKRVLGRCPLGFTRKRVRDQNGNLVTDADGNAVHEIHIEGESSRLVKLIHRLYTRRRWSAYEIAKHLNSIEADEWNGWTESTVKKILFNPANIGVFIWNMRSKVYDYELEKEVIVRNPRSEWVVYYNPELAIIPMRYYRAARRRRSESRRKSVSKKSRNELSASTLFSGTLYCGSCETELKLIRSAGDHKQMGCLNGPAGVHGCKLSSSKSVRIIEKYLLDYLLKVILDESAVQQIVERANELLAKQQLKPRKSDKSIKGKIESRRKKIDKLVRLSEDAPDELCLGYRKRIIELQAEVNTLSQQLALIKSHNAPPPPPLDVERVRTYLKDTRELLNQEVPAAAAALRALTGPISITQMKDPTKKRGAKWIAHFAPDLVRFLSHLSKNRNYPESITLEFLNDANWIVPQNCEIVVDHVTQYERLGPKFAELHRRGAPIQAIADAHGMCWSQAKEILDYGLTGQRPRWKSHRRSESPVRGTPKWKQIQPHVLRLRDKEKMSWPEIISWLDNNCGVKAHENTVRRAWTEHHQQEVMNAVEKGKAVSRGSSRRIPQKTINQIHKLLSMGKLSQRQIANQTGVSLQTVSREAKSIRSDKS